MLRSLFGVSEGAIGGALREAGRDLEALNIPVNQANRIIKTEPELQALIAPDANGPNQTKD